MAKAPTVGFLPGNDPEAFMANQEYQAALNRMEQALNARQNRFFDPSMLALAQGFLAPTQTGGFGESLGFAAKNIREAQVAEEKEERDIAEARLGLAGRGIEIERLRQRDREFAKLMGPETSGAPATGPLSRQQPAGPLSVAPKGFEGVQGIPVAPPNPNFMTGRQYLGMARLDPSIAPTTAIKDATKLEQDRYQVKEGGVQDLSSGMFYPFPKGELVERQIFGYDGVYKVDARTAALLDMYAANGDSRYYEVAKRAVEGPKAPPKPGETAPESKAPGKISSVAETEAEKAGATERAQQRTKAQEADRAETIKAGSDAPSRLGVYRQLDQIPGFSITLPAIRDVLTNAGLDQNMINQAQYGLSLMAQVQLQMSRLQQGQGAVSDFERSLFASAAIARTDNPDTIRAKLDLLRARAEFDREVAKAVRTYKGSIDDFKSGDDYANMVQRYEEKLGGIIQNRLGGTPPERPSAPKGRDNKGAAGRLPI